MTAQIERSEAPLIPSRLAAVERKLGIKLPDQYRRFLLSHNGGKPKPAFFRYKHQSGRPYSDSIVDWFLAIYDGEFDNFESYFNNYKVHQVRLPDELIPIAHDPGGNLICIAAKGANKGAVFFWDHECEAEDGKMPFYGNVHLISDGFDEFLELLTDAP